MNVRALILLGISLVASRGALSPEDRAKLPPPAGHAVDFGAEVRPILEASCITCHGRGRSKGGFAMDNRATFLAGGDSGPAAVPGESAGSLLIELVSGLNPDNVMPQKGSRLTPEEVGILRRWIDDGLPWDEKVSFGKLPPVNLHPRKPDLPQIAGVEHPVDRFLAKYFQERGIEPGEPVDDRVYARRVYLDLIGLLPSPEELEQFAADDSPDKRARLVRRILDRDFDYAQHWLTFWNDALRNDYKGTGYIDGGRKQITQWLFAALANNKPYDEFVAELINPVPGSEGFIKGIVWRGVVNASQTPQMQAAQNISQVFMGVNLKCASCHDSFINDWRLADAYGLASIYADGPLEMYRCDSPTGKTAEMKFIYPELGAIDPEADKEERLEQLARIVTSEKNGRLTRTIVNRLWARFMGRGLIEPVDIMNNPAWNQDLLDWLAADLAGNGYDLKRTMELITTSKAYQLPAVPVTEQEPDEFVFRGPLVRRMSAEQFIDALAQVTGIWDRTPAAAINFAELAGKEISPDFENQPVQPQWIWNDPKAASKTAAGEVFFRKIFDLPAVPEEASIIVSCDNAFQLYINGIEAGAGKDHTRPSVIDVRNYLRPGVNLVAVAARNGPGAPDNPKADQSNPAGLWVYARLRSGERVMDFGSGGSWLCHAGREESWASPDFPATDWQPASELGKPDAAPWRLGKALALAAANSAYLDQTRASLSNSDPLMRALGRPNREQVVTSRPSAATTLQALELTNGPTLAAHLRKAGEALAARKPIAEDLITAIYEKALGREPTRAELELSLELTGTPARPEGVEDLLWAVAMLPEFQLIY